MELKEIKGLGKKRIETLENKNISSLEELVLHFPKSYFDLESKDTFAEDGKFKLIKAKVISDVKIAYIKRNFNYSFVSVLDNRNFPFKAIWYNQPYIKNAIKQDDTLFLYGKNSSTKHGYFVVSNYKNSNKIKAKTSLFPIYKTYKNLGQSVLKNAIDSALDKVNIESIIPKKFEEGNLNFSLIDAIKTIHNPETKELLKSAKERIDIENILPIIKINQLLKNKNFRSNGQNYANFSQIMQQFCVFLPYTLTPSQTEVLKNIESDFQSNKLCNRLIQGDVGSGKTVVALIAAAVCLKNFHSSIFMAPTEILATQHYEKAKEIFSKLNLNVCLLTSSTSQAERRKILSLMKTEPVLLIGTHSVLSDEIDVSNVTLMIIDEQHRFGVKQRSAILNKAKSCDLIMLSATPIPRTLSLTYYGGLDVSRLNELPFKKQIQTNLVNIGKEKDLWEFIKTKIAEGSKVYVVCANIDDTDDDCYVGLSVKSMFDQLKKIFPGQVVMAHGKLNSKEENDVLTKFKNSSAKILVSTTIIEVGVDIPSADIMVLVSPEKFGLATLHQLRGRIGRAGQQSYCFCLTRNLNAKSLERITYFKEHLDGFEIAEYDYNERGAGEILSTYQHGRIDNPFDLVGIETLKKASNLFERLEAEYENTNFLLNSSKLESIKDIGLN